MKAEMAFHNELEMGLETYVEPLKNVISESAHKAIFMNLEEVSSLVSGAESSDHTHTPSLLLAPRSIDGSDESAESSPAALYL